MKMISYSHANKSRFHKKEFALGFALKVRLFGTRKWPIRFSVHQYFVSMRDEDIKLVVNTKHKVVLISLLKYLFQL